MTDIDHENDQTPILNPAYDAIVANATAPLAAQSTRQRLPLRPRIVDPGDTLVK
jgi:hypothetical protein